ncbi:MAG: hypothetical protein U0871_15245 [Gemmataceae bacterium]
MPQATNQNPQQPAPATPGRRPSAGAGHGLGQLTLVEHALCPLDAGHSLRENLVFETGYHYADKNRHQKKAAVKIVCPGGLAPSDEFYLWGLLALTFASPRAAGDEPDSEFHATPHFCLRRLGLIDQHANRGGRNYRHFADALDRLAQVSYASDAFYDPVRAEHRKVRFGFLSYSLPLDPASSRAWRVAWDPVFFDLVKPLGGQFRFDLDTYRDLDPAARRLFLLLSKIFDRRETTPRFDVRHLAVEVLGFSPTLAPRHHRQKLQRVIGALADAGIVYGPAVFDKATGDSAARGDQTIVLARGPRFSKAAAPGAGTVTDSPLWEALVGLGFDPPAAGKLLNDYPHRMVREWLDITLAARERFGPRFFKRSPVAYLVDNLRAARSSGRTPPEWWHELRSRERRRVRSLPGASTTGAASAAVPEHSAAVLRRVTEAVFGQQPDAAPASGAGDSTPSPRPVR